MDTTTKMDTQGMGSKDFNPEWKFYKINPNPSDFPPMRKVTYTLFDPLPRTS